MPFEERTALAAAIILSLLACVGQGVTYFTSDYDSYSTGLIAVLILSACAGIALTFEADVLPDSLDEKENRERSDPLATALVRTLLVIGIEFVGGEILFLVGLAVGAPGIDGDLTVILAPLLVGVLMGGLGCLFGILIGLLVGWPLVKLIGLAIHRRRGKPISPVGPGIALFCLTLVAFAILGTLGSNPPEVLGTPTGKGLYDIVYLYTNYAGTPPQQVMAWIARALGAVLILEGFWTRHIIRAVTRAAAPTPTT